MTRTMLFHRAFHGYSGGHGKVWDYFRHVDAHHAWKARIHFTPDSVADGNPWLEAGEPVQPDWRPEDAQALFLAGMDWQRHPRDLLDKPVINLIQGVRHADQSLPLRDFLNRPAIRVCVSEPVAEAIMATGLVRGPVIVIDAGIDVGIGPPLPERQTDIFIAAQKQAALGSALAERLRSAGISVDCVSDWLPRTEFLGRMKQARIAIALPLAREGFFLPGLEAMASGCAVVMPDAIGNRAYAVDGYNALMPCMAVDEVVAAASALLKEAGTMQALANAGICTAAAHDLPRERAALHRILDDLQPLWTQAWDATSH